MRPLRILCAEDDELARIEIKQEMEKEGWEVIEANDGRTAWKKFQQTHPDLVILDVDMPELTGLEVAQLILSIDLHTPIVMYSSLTKEQDLQTGLDHGAKCYIIKDYSPATLIRQIKQINETEVCRIQHLTQDITFDPFNFELNKQGECIVLTPIHGKVLQALCRNVNRLTQRDTLLEIGWGNTQVNLDAQLTKVISRLKQLFNDVENITIQTESKRGYWLKIK